MCGISGIYSYSRPVSSVGIRVESLTRCLLHRGPDSIGFWNDTHVAFGHTRLAIIDLSAAANQPFVDQTLELALIFNGEIYNYRELRAELVKEGYRFTTTSDTEVLIKAYHRWKTDAFQRLVGMWAFALFDMKTKELILCRDRFGIKPLYYALTPDSLVFSSELKGILANSGHRKANRSEVTRFLATGLSDTGSETFFENVYRMPPASYARIAVADAGRVPAFNVYWSAAHYATEPETSLSYSEATEELRLRLVDSVNLHLRSDVPIGMCVSGGIDSSVIAGISATMLGKEGRTPHAFSAIFPGSWFDESRYVTEVVSKWDLNATYVSPTRFEFEREIDDVIRCQEEPFGSTGVYLQWKLFQAIAQQGIKVVLDGQGADEYLAGYLPFLFSFMATGSPITRLRRFSTSFLPVAAANIGTLKHRFGSGTGLARAAIRALGGGEENDFGKIATADALLEVHSDPYEIGHSATGATPLKRALLRYLTKHSLPAILRFEDRNSMAFSIESRVPYLDHRLVEFCLGVPDDYLIRSGRTKAMLRDAGRSYLPRAVSDRRLKLGFATPQHDWTRLVVMKRLRENLESPVFDGLLNRDATRDLLAANLAANPGAPMGGIWWRLYNTARWQDAFSVS